MFINPFNHFDALAFLSGTSLATATGTPLINSAVLVALIVLLTKLVEWRIRAMQRRNQQSQADEVTSAKNNLAAELHENNRLLRKIAGEPEPHEQADNSSH